MSLHTALYGHKNCPGGVSVPQPPALNRKVVVEEEPPEEEEPPQMSHAQLLRMHLAQAILRAEVCAGRGSIQRPLGEAEA